MADEAGIRVRVTHRHWDIYMLGAMAAIGLLILLMVPRSVIRGSRQSASKYIFRAW